MYSVSHLPYLPLALYLEVPHDTPSCLGVPTSPEALSWSSWCTGPESQIVSTSLLIPVPTLSVTFPPRPRAVTESLILNTTSAFFIHLLLRSCALYHRFAHSCHCRTTPKTTTKTTASFQIGSILLLGKCLTAPEEKRGHVPRDIIWGNKSWR